MKDLTEVQFLQLIKKGTLEALKSSEGQDAIVSAMSSEKGQDAIVSAMSSEKGQAAIVNALKTPEAKEVFIENFTEAFNENILPGFEDHERRLIKLEHMRKVV